HRSRRRFRRTRDELCSTRKARRSRRIDARLGMTSLGRTLKAAVGRAQRGERLRVVFNVPPFNKCAGPLYEIVLMAETWLRRQRVRDAFDLVFTTYQGTFIQAFGPKLDAVVDEEFGARGIAATKEARLASVE